jgi:hypothetical protein
MVDDSCAKRECTGPVPHHLAIPALLQRADRILQEPGGFFDYNIAKTKLTV